MGMGGDGVMDGGWMGMDGDGEMMGDSALRSFDSLRHLKRNHEDVVARIVGNRGGNRRRT